MARGTPCCLILNLLTVMVFCRRRMRKYCLSLTMICLALFDMAILFFPVLLTWIDEIFFKFYFLNNTLWCNMHGYFDLVLCANSSWIIVLISVERWFAVCRPWEKARLFTTQRVGVALASIFLFSTLFFLYFPFSLTLKTHANSAKECRIEYEKAYNIFGTLSVILVYVMPFILLALLNAMIIFRLRLRPFKAPKVRKAPKLTKKSNTTLNASFTEANPPSMAGNDERSVNNEQNNDAATAATGKGSPNKANGDGTPVKIKKSKSHSLSTSNSKTDRNLSITLVTVAITFMILTFPFQMYWFYENLFRWLVESFQQLQSATSSLLATNSTQVNQTSPPSDSDPRLDTHFNCQPITFIIKNMNYVINFFLYSALSKLFRQEFVALLSDDKFILINKCVKCLLRRKAARHRNRKGIAELSITLNGLSGNGNGNDTSKKKKCFTIRIESAHLVRFIESFNNQSTNSVSRNEKTITKSVNRNEDEESRLIVEKSVFSDDGGIYDGGGDGGEGGDGVYDGSVSFQSVAPNHADQQSIATKSPFLSAMSPSMTPKTPVSSDNQLPTNGAHLAAPSDLGAPVSTTQDLIEHQVYVAQILASCDASSETSV